MSQKLFKSVVCTLLALITSFSCLMPSAFASSYPPSEVSDSVMQQIYFNPDYMAGESVVAELVLPPDLAQKKKTFDTMSIDELNSYIDSQVQKIQSTPSARSDAALRELWLAAAGVLRLAGLNCTSEIISYSVAGRNYSELNGIFKSKIMSTSAYQSWSRTWDSSSGMTFEQNDNADLFYSLHRVSARLASSSQGGRVYVSDVFDFAVDNSMDLTAYINNWGYLCQNAGVLHPISINIQFDL